jgi:hypothetical protein
MSSNVLQLISQLANQLSQLSPSERDDSSLVRQTITQIMQCFPRLNPYERDDLILKLSQNGQDIEDVITMLQGSKIYDSSKMDERNENGAVIRESVSFVMKPDDSNMQEGEEDLDNLEHQASNLNHEMASDFLSKKLVHVPEFVRPMLVFDVSTERDYYDGKKIPDITTLAAAARSGRLEFLQWCRKSGYANGIEKDVTVISYSRDQPHIMEWLQSLSNDDSK